MIAVKLKSNGRFLKNFSGSYNSQLGLTQFKIEKRNNPGKRKYVDAGFVRATKEDVLNEMFCEASLQNAKLFTGEKGAKLSLTGHFPLVDLVPISIRHQE